ncbi:MAG: hypothetical protein ACTSRL_14385 [Candidatus Helarchaeota archaeon]|nr:hypothetical protein [Deltaproteobacteria bacterium]
MPSKRDIERIEELKELAGKGLIEQVEIKKDATQCKQIAKVAGETVEKKKEVFWHCMRDRLEGESIEDIKKKYLR